MLAIAAAILFGLALLFDLAHIGLGGVIGTGTLVDAGLLCLALFMAGVGARTVSWGSRRRRR